MSIYFKKKELSAINGKIKRIENESDFFKKHLLKIIGFGLLISFWVPSYSSGDDITGYNSVSEFSNMNYFELVILSAITYSVLCFLTFLSMQYHDKKKLKRLTRRKVELERFLNKKYDADL